MHGRAVGQQPLGLPFRSVWIEKESINSVIVSDSPEDLHQRMLVAAALSVNATGECGTLRSSVLRSSLLSLTLATGDVVLSVVNTFMHWSCRFWLFSTWLADASLRKGA